MMFKKPTAIFPFLEHVLSLLVVFLLLVAAAAWTGSIFGRHIGQPAPQEVRPAAGVTAPGQTQLTALGIDPNSTRLTSRDSASWNVIDAQSGTAQGVVVNSAPYAREVTGFAGPTPVYVWVSAEGKVRAVAAADNAETPDFFNSAFEELANKWNGQTPEAAARLQVDAVSGATFSSKAVITNVQAALAAYAGANHRQQASPTIGWGRTAATAAVLLTGIAVCMLTVKGKGKRSPFITRPAVRKYVRLCVHVLNVGVLGFWCGQFLSVSLLKGWISSGLDPVAWLPTLLVLATALLLPFFGRKHYYCSWVCPYGSLQELAALLPLPKIHLPATAYKAMGRVRIGLLALLLLSLWTGIGAFLLDYEPFTAFMLNAAAPAVVVLAGGFIVAGCFVPHLWCRSLCPMGQLLDLSER